MSSAGVCVCVNNSRLLHHAPRLDSWFRRPSYSLLHLAFLPSLLCFFSYDRFVPSRPRQVTDDNICFTPDHRSWYRLRFCLLTTRFNDVVRIALLETFATVIGHSLLVVVCLRRRPNRLLEDDDDNDNAAADLWWRYQLLKSFEWLLLASTRCLILRDEIDDWWCFVVLKSSALFYFVYSFCDCIWLNVMDYLVSKWNSHKQLQRIC